MVFLLNQILNISPNLQIAIYLKDDVQEMRRHFFYPFDPLGRKLGPKFFETIVFRLIKSKECTKKYTADLYLWPHKGC